MQAIAPQIPDAKEVVYAYLELLTFGGPLQPIRFLVGEAPEAN